MQDWCAQNGTAPHPRLPDCLDVMLVAGMESSSGAGATSELAHQLEFERFLERAIECRGDNLEPEINGAFAQLLEFAQSEGKQGVFAALGLPPMCEDARWQ